MEFVEILMNSGNPPLYAFVVKQGGKLSSKVRRAICDEAKGISQEYIASAVYQNYPDTKRWTDSISKIGRDLTGVEYHHLNATLNIQHNDAIFVSERPVTFTVPIHARKLITGRFNSTRSSTTPDDPIFSRKQPPQVNSE